MLFQAKLHQDNSLLGHEPILTFKACAKDVISKIIAGGLGPSSSGIDVSIAVELFYVKSKISHETI